MSIIRELTIMIGISSIICIVCLVNGYSSQEVDVHANITQLFIHKITPELLSWNEKERQNDFHYTLTSMEGPDIPPWLHLKYSKKNDLYLFGVAPKELNVELLEVSITSFYSYRTKYFKLKIWFNIIDEYAKYEIHLRILNVDIEDMLNNVQQNNLIEIFEENFWKSSRGKLYITFMITSDKIGDQLPLNPDDTAGVVIHLGASVNFSEELLNLQNETTPLAKHCPSLYKRSTVERFFRAKHFVVDWCSFRLVTLDVECDHPSSSSELTRKNGCDYSNISTQPRESALNANKELLILKEALPQSPVHGIFTLFIIIPSVGFGLIITLWLVSLMCFNNKHLRRKSTKELILQDSNPSSELLFHF